MFGTVLLRQKWYSDSIREMKKSNKDIEQKAVPSSVDKFLLDFSLMVTSF